MEQLRELVLGLMCVFVIITTVRCQLLPTFEIPKFPSDGHTFNKIDLEDGRLLLTPYIEAGLQSTARKLAKVDRGLFLNTTSYAGYLTVDEERDSNLFFWFFPAEGSQRMLAASGENDLDDEADAGETEDTDFDHEYLKKLSANETTNYAYDEKPVVLWLQGGPGISSLMALFTENGPFFVDGTKLKDNPYSWHKKYHMLYIDNPVGTGFSFTGTDGYCENISGVARHLYIGLVQFFKLFPSLQTNSFYIAGESFAGKYIPAIADVIYEQNGIPQNYLKINLKGLALGNAFSDPYNMVDYSDFAYQLGLIGRKGHQEMKLTESLIRAYIDQPKLAKAYWDSTLHLFTVHSNYSNLYNIGEPKSMDLFPYKAFIDQPQVREALHVGGHPFSGPNTVYTHLLNDFMTTAMHWTERLLNAGLRIMYYNGNWDFIVAYPLSENSFHKMQWSGADEYKSAPRRPFTVNGKLHGYVTKARNFYEVSMLNSGHMVPTDQPIACLTLIDRFFTNKL
ncbi:venom serine carboxypeptidase-like [Eupeodes corollae]|uniref:venom serine carboxypeptidase-like n=1 Tax=Eupeodes corollae TaxID=290404 RepID=UPI0024937B74|nr:venom serine carboxypeptidase-like [Eupeodes corollae]